jgi:hypothetical protein
MFNKTCPWFLSFFVLSACNVESPDTTTTGVPLSPDADSPRVRGFFAVATDYESSAVSVTNARGEVVSRNLISTASSPAGLSAALSGDVAAPTAILSGSEVVLVDRLPAGVLTWVDLETAEVRAQLNVGTGFAANPQDYVPVSGSKAYVPRFAANFESGREPFDGGSDLLVIDPSVPAVTGRIDLAPAVGNVDSEFQVNPSRAIYAGGRVHVLIAGLKSDFSDALPGHVISVDPQTDTVAQVLVLDGLKGCTTFALSPDGAELAIGCTGNYGQDPTLGFPDSGIVLVAVGRELSERRRFAAADLGGEQIGSVAFATATSLVFTTTGRFMDDFVTQAAPDTLRRLNLANGLLTGDPLAQSQSTPFSIGDVRCAPEQVCLLADAETNGGVLTRFDVANDGSLVNAVSEAPNPELGLPPRYLGAF